MSNNHFITNRGVLYFLLLTLFILSRVLFLDADLPSFNIFNYQPIDEFWYNNMAFNLHRYSDIQHRILPYVESDSIPSNIFQNLITYITLVMFGNNYYGLRMASVIASFGILVLFYYTIRNYTNTSQKDTVEKQKLSRIVTVACMIYLAFDFSFLLASRVSEPTIFRMLSLAILMYFFSSASAQKHFTSNWFTLASGFIAFASVLFVYPSNAFLVPAIWGICIYSKWDYSFKGSAVQTLIFLAGGIICMVFYEFTLRIFFGKSFIDQLALYAGFVERVNLPGATEAAGPGLIKKSLTNIFGIFSTNIFRFNPILLMTWLAALPIVVMNVYKKRSSKEVFLLLVLFFFFIQLVFINDYYYRKLVFLLPLVLLTIAVAVKSFPRVIENARALLVYRVYLFVIAVFAVVVFLINCVPRWIGSDVITDQKYVILSFLVLQLVFLAKARNKIASLPVLATMLILLLAPSIYFSGRYIFISPTYTYKNTMRSISNYADGKLMVGGMSTGFRLYNGYKPVIDGYGFKNTEVGRRQYAVLLDSILQEKAEKYTILYKSPGNSLFHAGNSVYNGKIKPVLTLKLDKNPGPDESIALYKYIE